MKLNYLQQRVFANIQLSLFRFWVKIYSIDQLTIAKIAIRNEYNFIWKYDRCLRKLFESF